MWSLTSLRTKPIRSFRKSCLLPPKGFFDSIGQRRKLRLVTSMYALPPRPDLALASRLISPHPTWLATYPRSFSERPVFERRPCGDHCSAAACSTGRTASLAGRNTETTARLAALSMTERRSNPPSATARSARTLGVGHHTVDRDLGRENAGANAPTRLQTPSEAARAAGAHAPSGPTGTQAAKLVERRETGKAERQHLGLRGVPALSVTRREAAGSAPG